MDVLIAGLDEEQARTLETDVRRAVGELQATDVVTVAVLPSDAADRWDVGVQRTAGWTVSTLDSPVDELPTRVTDRLRVMKPR